RVDETVRVIVPQTPRAVPVLVGLGVVEQDETRAVDLVELGKPRELGAVDENGVEDVDAVLPLHLRDSVGGQAVLSQVVDVLFQPADDRVERKLTEVGGLGVVKPLDLVCCRKPFHRHAREVMADDEVVLAPPLHERCVPSLGYFDAVKPRSLRIPERAAHPRCRTPLAGGAPDLENLAYAFTRCNRLDDLGERIVRDFRWDQLVERRAHPLGLRVRTASERLGEPIQDHARQATEAQSSLSRSTTAATAAANRGARANRRRRSRGWPRSRAARRTVPISTRARPRTRQRQQARAAARRGRAPASTRRGAAPSPRASRRRAAPPRPNPTPTAARAAPSPAARRSPRPRARAHSAARPSAADRCGTRPRA